MCMAKMNTRLGEIEYAKDGDKYSVDIAPNTMLAETFEKFDAKDWVSLLEKCKASGMEADSIMTAANTEGTKVILSSTDKDNIVSLLNFVAELQGISKAAATPVKDDVIKTEINPDMAKEVSKKLGF